MSRDVGSTGRCLLVWGGTTLAAGGALCWLLPDLASSWPRATHRFDTALAAGCATVAAAGVAWLWWLVTLVVRDAVQRRPRRAGSSVPTPVRRAVLTACGLSLATVPAAPALATPDDAADHLVGLRVPDRLSGTARLHPRRRELPPASAAAEAAHPAPVSRAEEHVVVVVPGDTLWAIAERDLPATARPDEVDARWRAIHRANASLIGPDPHLILPGQRLRLPPAHREE
jgi:hypothetical protein